MPFTSIDPALLGVGKPVTTALLQSIKDNLDYLFGQLGTINLAGGIQNGSFELDTDADGTPDGWTKNLYPGGTGTIETTNVMHGAKGYKFVHPGGASNGGGYLESSYAECDGYWPKFIAFMHYATAAGMKNQVLVKWYTSAKVYISTSTVYDSIVNPTAAVGFIGKATPPSNARYFKVVIVGGESSVNVAGTAYFDGIHEATAADLLAGKNVDWTMAQGSTSNGAWTDMTGTAVTFTPPFVGLPCLITFSAELRNGTDTLEAKMRFRTATGEYSNEVSTISNVYGTYDFSLPIIAPTGPITLYMQLRATSGTAYGRKLSAVSTFRVNMTAM